MNLFYINETNTLKNHKEKVGDIMTSLKKANRRVGSLFAVAALVLATITPGLVPAFASAAQLSERSVTLSSSSKSVPGGATVQYSIEFTTDSAAGAVAIDFCSNSPLVGTSCSDPAGFSAASATGLTTDFDVTQTDAVGDDAIVVEGDIDGTVSFEVGGITNPSAAGPLYLRFVTYDTAANAEAYTATALGTGVVDEGSAGVSITDTIAVSGAVLETMTFCVSAAEPTANCGGVTAPTVTLAEANGALSSTATSEGSIYSQISTNAATGAVVNLKSTALACGGLVRAGAPTSCDIAPALAGGIADGEAKFGAQIGATTDASGGSANGDFQAFGTSTASAYYSDSVFKLNYVVGDGTGITSPYGDPFLDTAGAPVNNKNVQITFGASVANNTPAGLYSTDLSLIATGKF